MVINVVQQLQPYSSTHLSAILAHVGLASHHRPDVVIQAPVRCDTQWGLVKLRVNTHRHANNYNILEKHF